MGSSCWRRGTGLASQATVAWLHTSVHKSTAIVRVHQATYKGVYLTQTTGMNNVLRTVRDGFVENAQAIPVLG